ATTVPSARSARLWRPPAATAVTNCKPVTGTGTSLKSSLKPSPSCRYTLSPQLTALKWSVATVSVAALLVALPAAFVNTARYWWPFSEAIAFSIASWPVVAPGTALHVLPPLIEISHCTVGAGNPEAVASKRAFPPTSMVVPAGCWVTRGSARTVSVAAWLVTLPAALVNTARYSWPSSEEGVLVIVSWVEVAPSIALHVPPPSVETSHCTVGAGNPEAVASKRALCPSLTVTLTGCLVTDGAFCTVSVAASLVASPAAFLNVARYWWPLSVVFAPTIVSWLDVPPATAVQVLPPLAEVSHLTVGAGKPEALASKTAFWPSSTVMLSGCLITAGILCTVSVAALLVASPTTFL